MSNAVGRGPGGFSHHNRCHKGSVHLHPLQAEVQGRAVQRSGIGWPSLAPPAPKLPLDCPCPRPTDAPDTIRAPDDHWARGAGGRGAGARGWGAGLRGPGPGGAKPGARALGRGAGARGCGRGAGARGWGRSRSPRRGPGAAGSGAPGRWGAGSAAAGSCCPWAVCCCPWLAPWSFGALGWCPGLLPWAAALGCCRGGSRAGPGLPAAQGSSVHRQQSQGSRRAPAAGRQPRTTTGR